MQASYQGLGPVLTLVAAADFSTNINCAVTIDSNGKVALPAAGGAICGVLTENPVAGQAAPYQHDGIAATKFGGTVNAGDIVKVDTAGRFLVATAANILAGQAVGVCVEGGTINQMGCCQLMLSGNGYASGLSETVTAAGAISIRTEETDLSVTGTVAYTLAAGVIDGQRKRIRCIVAASTPLGSVTIANPCLTAGMVCPAVITFTAVGQYVDLQWNGATWVVTGSNRAGTQVAVIGTTVLTGLVLALLYDCQVTGTVSSTTTKSIPDGLYPGDRCYVGCSVAATIPVGNINFTGQTFAGAAVTDLQAIGATTDTVTLNWTGLKWLVTANSGITVA